LRERFVSGEFGIAGDVNGYTAAIAKVHPYEHEQAVEIAVCAIVFIAPGAERQEVASPTRPNVGQMLHELADALRNDEDVADVPAALNCLLDFPFL
jgi:hypothetical protein